MLRVLFTLLVVGVTIYALVDCLRAPASHIRGPRYAWILGIVVLPLVGAVLYLSTGRESVGRGRLDRAAARPQTIAPDDDPEFLRSLEDRMGPKPGETNEGDDEPSR